MSKTNPVRFVVWCVLFVSGVVIGFLYHSEIVQNTVPLVEAEVRTAPVKTRIRGETTEVKLEERFVLIEWMKFDGEDVQSVCRASEIVRKGDSISLKDPILYDYSRETSTVTRTSGKFGEATLLPGVTRELDAVRIWGEAAIFRYKVRPGEFQEVTKSEKTAVTGIPDGVMEIP